jgi:AcrR family transcriptional regulator
LDNEPPGTRRPGGRTARIRAAVLQAVISELVENGYAGTTVERIAARAGVAKTTIYRRWGRLDGLLADLMTQYAAQEIPVPDTGRLDSDLRALAREIVASLQSPAIRAAFASVVAAAIQDRGAREVLSRFIAARIATMTVIVARASQRGELPDGADAAEALQIVTAQIYYRLFIAGEEPSHGIADRAAATAAAAARANVSNTAANRTYAPAQMETSRAQRR